MMNVETMKLVLEALEFNVGEIGFTEVEKKALTSLRQAIEQAQQAEPVAMKFKIYKPTAPDPTRQGINNALLPWVYDQDKSSGFDASMWVTPVATLPLPRQPLTDEKKDKLANAWFSKDGDTDVLHRKAIALIEEVEASHGIKE